MTSQLVPDASSARFSMLLPETWQVLDFDPATRDRSIEKLVRRAVGRSDALVLVRRWAIDTYRQMYESAAATGMFFGANYAGEIEGRPLSASVLAFITAAPVTAGGDAMGIEAIAASLALGDDEERPIDLPQLVDLPVGTAVRTRARIGVHQVGSDGREPEMDVVRFFAPVPEWGLMLVIAFSTPMLAASGAFAELFDSMAATARWRT